MADATIDNMVRQHDWILHNGGTGGLIQRVERNTEAIEQLKDKDLLMESRIEKSTERAIKKHSRSVESIVKGYSPIVTLIVWIIYELVKGA